MIKNSWLPLAAMALGTGCAGEHTASPLQGVVEFEEVDLSFEYPGRLVELWVERGARVEKGERIAALNDVLERAAVHARASETEAARARAAVVQAGSRPEEVRALEARIRAADAAIRQLSDQVDREGALMESGVTPRAVVDELRAELDRARAERDALAQSLRLLVKGPRREEVAQVAAQARATEALLEAQQARAGAFELTAPRAGDVIDHHYWPGEFVPLGAPVVTLADTSRPFVEVFVPEPRVASIALGQAADVRIDGVDVPLGARVEHIARHTEFTPRFLFSERERPNLVVRVRLRIDDPERRLRAGVPARVAMGAARGGD